MLTYTIDFAEVCRRKRNSNDRRKTDQIERWVRERTNVLLGRNIQDMCKKYAQVVSITCPHSEALHVAVDVVVR